MRRARIGPILVQAAFIKSDQLVTWQSIMGFHIIIIDVQTSDERFAASRFAFETSLSDTRGAPQATAGMVASFGGWCVLPWCSNSSSVV